MSTTPSVLSSVETGLNTLWGNTLGQIWSAATGTLDPWTNANVIANAQQNVATALGPNATPAQIAAAQQSVGSLICGYTHSIGAAPDQATLFGGVVNAWNYYTAGTLGCLPASGPGAGLFGAQGPFNPANWSSTTILIVAGLVILAFLALGWGLHH